MKKIALIGTLRRKGTNQNLIVQDVDLFQALLGFSFCCQHLDLILLVLEQLLELFALLLEGLKEKEKPSELAPKQKLIKGKEFNLLSFFLRLRVDSS